MHVFTLRTAEVIRQRAEGGLRIQPLLRTAEVRQSSSMRLTLQAKSAC
jgi:hypothetical protein